MRITHTALLTSALFTAVLMMAAAACGGEPTEPPVAPTTPPGPETLLIVDGLTITFGEVEPLVRYLDSVRPLVSRKQKLRTALERQVVPTRLAARAFADRRKELRAQAETLAEVADNVHDLETRASAMGGQRRDGVKRRIELPVEGFLFDPSRTGQVSPAIEVAQGFLVVAAYELDQASLTVDDRVDAYMVPFLTHDMRTFRDWLEGEKERVADRVTYVHPDYRDVLPHWLKAP